MEYILYVFLQIDIQVTPRHGTWSYSPTPVCHRIKDNQVQLCLLTLSHIDCTLAQTEVNMSVTSGDITY